MKGRGARCSPELPVTVFLLDLPEAVPQPGDDPADVYSLEGDDLRMPTYPHPGRWETLSSSGAGILVLRVVDVETGRIHRSPRSCGWRQRRSSFVRTTSPPVG
jgi:hypothetical protein